ncbi:hypothetical protein AALP_AA1G138800 [Arabis alpina]|uniref:SKI-interacting protein SKIP SNW domain-containing protein n=1 Tax=Arabis alpina TaxID=50452 RepID=A0A087HN30_ARAAL|nr:hypothetical protein AALP_AA1G138800 [Arabis alpina]
MTSRKVLVPPEEKPTSSTFYNHSNDPWFKDRSIEPSDITRMVETPVDLLEPPKSKHKRVPKAFGSLPVHAVYSSPRPVTIKNQQDWNIPPCVSNWENLEGYEIPLTKRLKAYNGRGIYDFVNLEINNNFAKVSNVLNEADQRAREAISMRLEMQKEMEMMKEKREGDKA